MESFRIRDIQVEPGSKEFGYIKIEESHSNIIKMPLGIVNGSKNGPVLCLTGGLYGTIYPGIEAVIQLWNEIDPQKLNGTILMVPVVNTPSFQWCTPYISPVDKKDLNTRFPGSLDSTISDTIAYILFHEVILKSKYHIDFRGGDLDEQHTKYFYCFLSENPAVNNELLEIAKIFGMEYLNIVPLDIAQERFKGSLMLEAVKRDVISMICMGAEGLGRYDEEDVQLCIKCAKNVMKYLNMISGDPNPYHGPLKKRTSWGLATAKHSGLWYPRFEAGQNIKKDEIVGEIKNLKGEVIESVFSPKDGIIHIIFPKHVVNRGEYLFTYVTYEDF